MISLAMQIKMYDGKFKAAALFL